MNYLAIRLNDLVDSLIKMTVEATVPYSGSNVSERNKVFGDITEKCSGIFAKKLKVKKTYIIFG